MTKLLDGLGCQCLESAAAAHAEGPRNAKGRVKAQMCCGSYRETTDQPALSARMDLQQAFARSRPFRKFCSE
jgi:hypothetical protein